MFIGQVVFNEKPQAPVEQKKAEELAKALHRLFPKVKEIIYDDILTAQEQEASRKEWEKVHG